LLNDMPLPILSVAAQVAQSKQTYTRIMTDLQGRKPWAGPGADPAVGPSLEHIVSLLDAADRRLLTALAAFPPQGASSEALGGILGLSVNEFQERVDRLQASNLIHAIRPAHQKARHGAGDVVAPRLALVSAYYQTVRTWLVDDAARGDVINYYATRLGHGDQLTGEELPGLLIAIEDCAQNGKLDLLEPMVTAADRGLAKLRWWAAWQHVLNLVRRTAQAEGDRALEAWAMHQLGSVAGALRDYERGIPLLRTAMSLRQAIGDAVGTALSARNLSVLERLMPAPLVEPVSEPGEPAERLDEPDTSAPALQREDIPESAPAPARRTRRVGLGLALLVACVLLLAGALALRYGREPSQGQHSVPPLTVSWEFGDAWNAVDNETWTQQIKIVAADGDGDYRYFVNGEAVGEMFQVVLPLCDGASGIIRVESKDGQSVEVPFEFDSPYCR
jgi:hypothetical protein